MTASDHTNPNQFTERFNKAQSVTAFGGEQGNEYVAPNGKTYIMEHETGNMTRAATPGGRTAGRIATFGFGSSAQPEAQTIHKIVVSKPHRGKGVATALMDYQRLQQPDLHHSSALTDDGKKFAAATPRIWQPKLDPNPHYPGSINDSNSMNWKSYERQGMNERNDASNKRRQAEREHAVVQQGIAAGEGTVEQLELPFGKKD